VSTNVPVVLLMRLALGNFSTSSGIAQCALFALLSAATAVANVDGMEQSAGKWNELSNQLGALQGMLNDAAAKADDGWTADDKTAFKDAIRAFSTELDDAKAYFAGAGGAMENAHQLYSALWLGLFTLSALLLATLLILAALYLVPVVGEGAKAAAETLANLAARVVDIGVKVAAGVLTAIATVVGASVSAGLLNLATPARVGGPTGVEDFKQIKIDYHSPSVYVAPTKP
jgi:hypothetical protein